MQPGSPSAPDWMTPEDKQDMLYYILGRPQRPDQKRREGLIERKVEDGDAIYRAAQYMRIRRYGREDTLREEANKLFLQAIYMAYHKETDNGGLPKELPLGDIASHLRDIDLKKWTRDQMGRFLKYDGLAERGEMDNRRLLGETLPAMSDAQRFGLAVRNFEKDEDETALTKWFEDVSRVQQAARDGLGKFLPYEVVGPALTEFRREADEILPVLESYMKGRLATTGRESLLMMDLGEEGNLLRRVLLVHLIVAGEPLSLEGARDGIRVNCLAPTAATRMTEGLLPPALLCASPCAAAGDMASCACALVDQSRP